ncbi:MAG: S49 family peptidase [Verrucomicrobia bacterium]|nr:S49 family peptidase [Verrucomicrobiota bacterium]
MIAGFLFSILSAPNGYEEKTELTILPNLDGTKHMVSTAYPAILRINVHGIIGEPKGIDSETMENILIDSRLGLLSNNRVKGILLHINTPGGTVVDSDNIYRMIKSYKEKYHVPVFTFVDGMCASGGMYIASSSDQIFASVPSVVGSIGVRIGPFFNVFDAMGKIGVQSTTFTKGLDKDMLNPFRPWKEGEDDSLKNILATFYEQFVAVVTENRPKVDRTKLIGEYGAQVFDGTKGVEIGYVDVANATYEQAVIALMKEAQVDPSKPYQIIELKPRSDWLSTLASGQSPIFSGKLEHDLSLGGQKAFGIQDQFSYIYKPEFSHE